MVPAFKNDGERSKGANCRPVSLLSVVSKSPKEIRPFFLTSIMVLSLLNQHQIFPVVSDRVARNYSSEIWGLGLFEL